MKQNELSTKLSIRKIKSFLTKITPKIHLSILFFPKAHPLLLCFQIFSQFSNLNEILMLPSTPSNATQCSDSSFHI